MRRLRENAEFLIEGDDAPTRSSSASAPIPASVTAEEPEEAARAAAAGAPNDAEAFRRAELARQAAERRKRFEERRTTEGRGPIFGEGSSSTAVIVVGALILVAGIGFGATRLLGGDDEGGTAGGGGGGQFVCPPQQTKVAVLNGTAEAGLAQSFAGELRKANYERGPVTNTESAFDTSVVMFDDASRDCAPEVASTVGVPTSEPMTQEIAGIAEGSELAVVLGEDQVTGTSTTSDTSTSTDSSSSGALGD